MARLTRLLLVGCTAFATFLAASLQGRVLCWSAGGEHFAIEAPHPETGCPSQHDSHHDTHEDHSAGDDHEPAPADCTDVSAEFVVGRDAAAASPDISRLAPAGAPVLVLLVASLALPDLRIAIHHGSDPPHLVPGDLARLRTIILLA